MNNDLISRAEALKELTNVCCYNGDFLKEGIGILVKPDEVAYRLRNIPAVDAEPVRHGRWILNKHYGDYECSVCGEGNFRAWDFREHTMNYCPNCGAKMDKAKAGE